MANLTVTQVAQQQALSEGYQLGPTPPVNNANVNTQASIGNVIVPVAEPVPYYPPATNTTPNIGLSLQGLDPVVAEDMVLIDTALATGNSGTVLVTTATLTNAQIIASASGAAGPTLIPAPGVGKYINVIACSMEFRGILGYTGLTGIDFGFSLHGHDGSLFDFVDYQPTTGFFDQNRTMFITLPGSYNNVSGPGLTPVSLTTYLNSPLVFFLEDSITGGGNVSNELVITLYYTIITAA